MAKLPRVTVIQYGSTGPSTDFGQFGSKAAAAPQTSQDPSVIQQLAAWVTGWTAAAVGAAFNPYLEDMNGAFYVFGYFIANAFERGVADWDAGTTYYKGAVVQDPAGSGQLFYSLTDNNLNNALPLGASNAQWRWQNPPANLVGASATTNVLPKVSGASPAGGQPGGAVLADSHVSDDGVDIIISLPLKFPDNTVQTTAATNPNAVTVQSQPSRVLDGIYQNTGSKPRFVLVTAVVQGRTATFYCDAAASPTTVIAIAEEIQGVSGVYVPVFFIVLPGYYYKVSGAGVTINNWTEWA